MATIGAIVLDEKDNVATAVRHLSSGERIDIRGQEKESLILNDDIPEGHKLALRDIMRDDYVIKYGEVIGKATASISRGSHVHVHNVGSIRGKRDL